MDKRLANEGQERHLFCTQIEGIDECVEDWVGTVELAGTVTVPPLSVRIARCRVIRRGDSAVVKGPRNQVVMVDPECLPGIYMARIVATPENKLSSTEARGSDPLVGKSPLVVVPPQNMCVAGVDGENSRSGTGENQSELPEGGLVSAATVPESDLQAMRGSLPVENSFGTQVDTNRNYEDSAEGQSEIKKEQSSNLSIQGNQGKLYDETERMESLRKAV